MSDYRTEGVVTLLASTIHGGEHAGTTSYLRRERIVQPDGSVAEVPVISGNGVRGMLRDISADITWRMLGEPHLSMQTFDVLWSGGSLAKAGAGHVLSTQDLRSLRDLCPHIGVFGAAGGGRIIEGRLKVGKMMPVCAETSHLLPEELRSDVSIWDYLQVEEFTRRDDGKRPMKALESGEGSLITEEREVPHQMRYGAGCRTGRTSADDLRQGMDALRSR